METLKERISRHEGRCLEPYRCTAGKLTIGVGRNYEDNPLPEFVAAYLAEHKCITNDMVDQLLDQDIERCEKHVDNKLPWAKSLEKTRYEILVEMCFQLGIYGLMQFHKTLACLEAGDIDGTVHNMLDSDWHRQTPARAEELANLMLKGDNQ